MKIAMTQDKCEKRGLIIATWKNKSFKVHWPVIIIAALLFGLSSGIIMASEYPEGSYLGTYEQLHGIWENDNEVLEGKVAAIGFDVPEILKDDNNNISVWQTLRGYGFAKGNYNQIVTTFSMEITEFGEGWLKVRDIFHPDDAIATITFIDKNRMSLKYWDGEIANYHRVADDHQTFKKIFQPVKLLLLDGAWSPSEGQEYFKISTKDYPTGQGEIRGMSKGWGGIATKMYTEFEAEGESKNALFFYSINNQNNVDFRVDFLNKNTIILSNITSNTRTKLYRFDDSEFTNPAPQSRAPRPFTNK